jgi:hypothetical protein
MNEMVYPDRFTDSSLAGRSEFFLTAQRMALRGQEMKVHHLFEVQSQHIAVRVDDETATQFFIVATTGHNQAQEIEISFHSTHASKGEHQGLIRLRTNPQSPHVELRAMTFEDAVSKPLFDRFGFRWMPQKEKTVGQLRVTLSHSQLTVLMQRLARSRTDQRAQHEMGSRLGYLYIMEDGNESISMRARAYKAALITGFMTQEEVAFFSPETHEELTSFLFKMKLRMHEFVQKAKAARKTITKELNKPYSPDGRFR